MPPFVYSTMLRYQILQLLCVRVEAEEFFPPSLFSTVLSKWDTRSCCLAWEKHFISGALITSELIFKAWVMRRDCSWVPGSVPSLEHPPLLLSTEGSRGHPTVTGGDQSSSEPWVKSLFYNPGCIYWDLPQRLIRNPQGVGYLASIHVCPSTYTPMFDDWLACVGSGSDTPWRPQPV